MPLERDEMTIIGDADVTEGEGRDVRGLLGHPQIRIHTTSPSTDRIGILTDRPFDPGSKMDLARFSSKYVSNRVLIRLFRAF